MLFLCFTASRRRSVESCVLYFSIIVLLLEFIGVVVLSFVVKHKDPGMDTLLAELEIVSGGDLSHIDAMGNDGNDPLFEKVKIVLKVS